MVQELMIKIVPIYLINGTNFIIVHVAPTSDSELKIQKKLEIQSVKLNELGFQTNLFEMSPWGWNEYFIN